MATLGVVDYAHREPLFELNAFSCPSQLGDGAGVGPRVSDLMAAIQDMYRAASEKDGEGSGVVPHSCLAPRLYQQVRHDEGGEGEEDSLRPLPCPHTIIAAQRRACRVLVEAAPEEALGAPTMPAAALDPPLGALGVTDDGVVVVEGSGSVGGALATVAARQEGIAWHLVETWAAAEARFARQEARLASLAERLDACEGRNAALEQTTRGVSEALSFVVSHGKAAMGKFDPVAAAVAAGRCDVLSTLLQTTPTVAASFVGHKTVHKAAAAGDDACVELFIRQCRDCVDSISSGGDSALHLAARHGHAAVVKRLIAEGAAVDTVDSKGTTPLLIAAELGHTAVLEALIAGSADTTVVNKHGRSAVHLAAERGFADACRLLVAAGAPVNATNALGHTPLHSMLARGDVTTHVAAKTLIAELGADVNTCTSTGFTPLHAAATSGACEVVAALIASGATVDAPHKDGATPLYHACAKGRADAARLLLDAKADVHAKQTTSGMTALHAAAFGGHTNCLALLLSHGAIIDSQSGKLWTPLHIAAEKGDAAFVAALIAANARLDVVDAAGRTPLWFATQNERTEVVRLLVTSGTANVDAESTTGHTALHLAAQRGFTAIAKLLVEEGKAKVNTASRDGASPLHAASFNGHKECVALLIAAGGDVNASRSANGGPRSLLFGRGAVDDTPLSGALAKGFGQVAALLKAAGARR